ncbi:RNA polymerase sigma-70 factor [Rhizobium subbaraonis]|uniref:RNA polymerase sigma-70 factor n=2 Tax=Rhizobium subbaraonis TaxID=908946 RepID=A0A285ULE5_9HYPH|nr:RNA polymerase sigma-70 factor [Rhizobium subbaraonis]
MFHTCAASPARREYRSDLERSLGEAMRQTAETDEFRRELVGLLPKLRRFAMTLTRNASDADDLVQEACERAITRSHLWNGEGRLESWIYAMTRNLWVDEVRKRKVRTGSGTVDFSEQDDLHIEASADKAVYAKQLHKLIMTMPEGLSSVFLLVNVEGHSYREAADILGIPIGTVMSRLSTARIRLAAMISEQTERRT